MSDPENIVAFPNEEGIEKEAALWVARMDTRALTLEERAELASWTRQSAVHAHALARMRAVWGGADVLDQYHEIEPFDGAPAFPLSRRTLISGGAIAAGFAVAAAVIVTLLLPAMQAATFQTAVGEQKTIALADGSTLVLNTDSLVTIDIGRDVRNIRLIRGEAHFSVKKDAARPFYVFAGEGAVRAVGTAFSVHVRNKDIEVTVNEGVVELLTRAASSTTQNPKLESLAALSVNENAVFTQTVERVEKLTPQETERKLLWRDGLVGFEGEPLTQVIEEVSRYTEIKIEIDDPDLGAIPIGGFFSIGDVEGLFEALENVFQVEAEWVSENEVRLTRSV